MAKKSAIKKNIERRKKIGQFKKKRSALKLIIKNQELSFEDRLKAQVKLSELPRNSSSVRYRNRCSITGRPRGFYRKFSMSRIALRDLASWGQVPGLIKSSW